MVHKNMTGNSTIWMRPGIMQTGWTDIGKKRYYFDMDGICRQGL